MIRKWESSVSPELSQLLAAHTSSGLEAVEYGEAGLLFPAPGRDKASDVTAEFEPDRATIRLQGSVAESARFLPLYRLFARSHERVGPARLAIDSEADLLTALCDVPVNDLDGSRLKTAVVGVAELASSTRALLED